MRSSTEKGDDLSAIEEDSERNFPDYSDSGMAAAILGYSQHFYVSGQTTCLAWLFSFHERFSEAHKAGDPQDFASMVPNISQLGQN